MDYRDHVTIDFAPSVPKADVERAFTEKLGRPLSDDELKDILRIYDDTHEHRVWLQSPNRKFERAAEEYDGCYDCQAMALEKSVAVLRADDLSDWLLTIQSTDASAYPHALSKWRDTDSLAWLVAALSKAEKNSRQLQRLIKAGEKLQRDEPAFASVAYHLIRLKTALGDTTGARKLVDEIISWQSGSLPLSAQNQFLDLRLQLAANLTEYLKFGQRKPMTFYEFGRYGSLAELLKIDKSLWDPDGYVETKEEFERQTDETFKQILPWDERMMIDDDTVDVINWTFPLQTMLEATHNAALPDYLRRQFALAVWTRAVLLKNESVAEQITPEIAKIAPELQPVFSAYQQAGTKDEKERAALFVLLKFQNLSPFVSTGLPVFSSTEDEKYYLEGSWWCAPVM